jgi:hypothetical protein
LGYLSFSDNVLSQSYGPAICHSLAIAFLGLARSSLSPS